MNYVVLAIASLILNFRAYSDAIRREEQRKSDELLARLYTMDIDVKKSMVPIPGRENSCSTTRTRWSASTCPNSWRSTPSLG